MSVSRSFYPGSSSRAATYRASMQVRPSLSLPLSLSLSLSLSLFYLSLCLSLPSQAFVTLHPLPSPPIPQSILSILSILFILFIHSFIQKALQSVARSRRRTTSTSTSSRGRGRGRQSSIQVIEASVEASLASMGEGGAGSAAEVLNERAVTVIRRVEDKLTGRDFIKVGLSLSLSLISFFLSLILLSLLQHARAFFFFFFLIFFAGERPRGRRRRRSDRSGALGREAAGSEAHPRGDEPRESLPGLHRVVPVLVTLSIDLFKAED